MRTPLKILAAGVLATAALAGPAPACRLALVFALDVSASVDADEYRMQRAGLAAALTSPEVQQLLFAGGDPVAITAFEWSGMGHQTDVIDWTLLTDPAALTDAAAIIASAPRSETEFPTGLGSALGYGSTRLSHAPACLRKTIDVSGDGVQNQGFPPESAYRAFSFAGVTVNGLVVTSGPQSPVVIYYSNHVIRGPGAFVEVANGYTDFERAMRRKLLRELGGILIGEASPQPDAGGG